MKWQWKKNFHKNWQKILAHMSLEYSAIGAWYIALEGDPIFWPIGIATAFGIHMIAFHIIDILHEHHHHHKDGTTHDDHVH